jgi:branched-chain amino acid transport system substrate-binding protein
MNIDRKRAALLLAAPFVAAGTPGLAQTPQVYKIGMTFPLTGPLAASGIQYVPAAQVAVNHINRMGGIHGHQLQIVAEDTAGTPQGGVTAMRKLVEVDGVQAIISIYTNVVTAQIPLATQLKVPFICPAQAPDLMNKSAYSFAHAETIPSTGDLYRKYWQKLHAKKIYQLVPSNAVGPYFSATIKNAVAAIGGQYAETVFNYGEGDYRGLVARVKEYNPDRVIIAVQGGIDDTTIIKQLRESGVNVPIDLSANFYEEPAWRAGIGTYINNVTLSGVAIDPKAGKQFTDDYRIATGHPPSPVAAEVYDMAVMIASAITKGGYDGTAIAQQLAVLKGVPSVLGGTITMDPQHYSPPAHSLWQVRNGKMVQVQS